METTKFYKIIIVLLILLNIGTLVFLWVNKPKSCMMHCPRISEQMMNDKTQQENSPIAAQPPKPEDSSQDKQCKKNHPAMPARTGAENPQQDRHPEGTPHNKPNEFIKQELNFDKQQEAKFEDLSKKHFNKEIQLHDSLKFIKKKFFDLLSSGNDFKKEEYLNIIGTLEKSRIRNNYDFFRDIKKICNDDQKEQLDRIIKDVLRMMSGPPKK